MNPYAQYLNGRDPLDLIGDTPRRVEALVASWPDERFERSYGPGKWTARELMTHLVHTELAFGMRARMALTTPGYVVQPFDQDEWMRIERASRPAARDALAVYLALRAMNAALFRSLTPGERATSFTHPERGAISVQWIIELLAGHDIHHLKQLEQIA